MANIFTELWLRAKAHPILTIIIIVVSLVVMVVLAIPTVIGLIALGFITVGFISAKKIGDLRGGRMLSKEIEHVYPLVANFSNKMCWIIASVYFYRKMVDEYGYDIDEIMKGDTIGPVDGYGNVFTKFQKSFITVLKSIDQNQKDTYRKAMYMELARSIAELFAFIYKNKDKFAKWFSEDHGLPVDSFMLPVESMRKINMDTVGYGHPLYFNVLIFWTMDAFVRRVNVARISDPLGEATIVYMPPDITYALQPKDYYELIYGCTAMAATLLSTKPGQVGHAVFLMKQKAGDEDVLVEYDAANSYPVFKPIDFVIKEDPVHGPTLAPPAIFSGTPLMLIPKGGLDTPKYLDRVKQLMAANAEIIEEWKNKKK